MEIVPLTSQRVRLAGLPASAFQHELDRQATEQLRKLKGFDFIVAKFMEYGIERVAYVTHMSSSLRVGPRQMPQLYDMLRESCAILDVPEPELYVASGGIAAYTSGHNNPYIVLETGLLELMDDEETMYVIAHELGHIKCNHVLYTSMTLRIAPLLNLIPHAGALVSRGVEAAFLTWMRRSEYSADRAALLAVQDVRPCLSTLMKLAGGTTRWTEHLSVEAFLEQARTYREGLDQNLIAKFHNLMISSKSTHPFATERARILDEWVSSPHYKRILSGDYTPASPKALPSGSYDELFADSLVPPTVLPNACPQLDQVETPPPPIQIFIHRNNERFGPYSFAQVQEWLTTGYLNLADPAWYQGAEGWVPLSQVPGIQASSMPRR